MSSRQGGDHKDLIFAPAGAADVKAAQYLKGTLRREELHLSPFDQFRGWAEHARRNSVQLPESACLSTASLPSGKVSSRFVYLKELDERGFIIYSNWGTSRKAEDVASNPQASLALWWREVERQVRIEGTVERLSAPESQSYFSSRGRGSKIGAWASKQSAILAESEGGRQILDAQVAAVEQKFDSVDDIPVPDFWGGLRIVPDMVEFWQGRDSRLHDRFRYTPDKLDTTKWIIERLSP